MQGQTWTISITTTALLLHAQSSTGMQIFLPHCSTMGLQVDNSLFSDQTPLDVAARLGFKELVTLLLERNTPVDGIIDDMR